ncbi:sigma-70 family RNA polymerase sigma factor [Robertmurraya korlensis]|uniref:sigma-70 family RNA polymerase sigma factor n=1 Tax=Robertmurraya korlensis TaxID=519977 RepID=UPI0008255F81|nr:sigma-70 family RNA polymerase sigma factor [Robertmurraya korlensis]
MNIPLNDKNEDKKKSIEELIDEFGKPMMNLAYTYVKDWRLAEDVMQEVFISIYKDIDNLPNITSYKAWIYRITVNKCKDLLRKKFFKKDIIFDFFGHFSKSEKLTPEEQLLVSTERKSLSLSVLELPVRYREVIILYYYEDFSTAEIAELLSQNVSTVKTKLNRGRQLLKSKLNRGDWFEY